MLTQVMDDMVYKLVIGISICFCSCNIQIGNEPAKPLRVITFNKSMYEVRGVLDSIVDRSPGMFYDTSGQPGLLGRYATVANVLGQDTIIFSFYFSGDHLDWLSHPDSSFLVLRSIARYKSNKLRWKPSEKLTEKEVEFFESKLDSILLIPVRRSLESLSPYSYKALNDEYPYRFEVCHIGRCDTVTVKRVDGRNALNRMPLSR